MKKFILILFIALILYIFFVEPNLILISKFVIESEKLNKSFDGFKIVQISDLHIKSFGFREKMLVFLIERIKPDILIITGDFYEKKEGLLSCQKFLNRMQWKTYAVLGNWDYWGNSSDTLINILKNYGVETLINDSRFVFKEKDFINIVGVDDPHTERDNIKKSQEGVNFDKFTILLAHSPDVTLKFNNEKFDLILCGHTHGGQIFIPFIKPFWIPIKSEFIKGMYETKWGKLCVNRGIGKTAVPVRFLSFPEITIFVLKSQKN